MSRSSVLGREVVRLVPKRGATGRHLLFIHGGGFVDGLKQTHWWLMHGIAHGTGHTLTLPLYDPSAGSDAAYALLDRVYDGLLAEASPDVVTLGGDSAGAAVALGFTKKLRDLSRPLPRQLLLFSPWLDLELTNPDVVAAEALDPFLSVAGLRANARAWVGDHALDEPWLSPAHGSMDGLPPVHTFQGGRDLLAPDTQLVVERLRSAGNRGTATYEPGGVHSYANYALTSSARRTMTSAQSLLR